MTRDLRRTIKDVLSWIVIGPVLFLLILYEMAARWQARRYAKRHPERGI